MACRWMCVHVHLRRGSETRFWGQIMPLKCPFAAQRLPPSSRMPSACRPSCPARALLSPSDPNATCLQDSASASSFLRVPTLEWGRDPSHAFLVQWRADHVWACDPPEPNVGFIAVACGGGNVPIPPITMFLRDNGSIEMCGGPEPYWPEPNSGFVAIACAGWQGLAVRGQPTASISLAFEPSESIRAFPNPFSVWTTITGLDEEANVTIYNALGRSVRRLNGARWDGLNEQGQDVAAGSYFAKVNQAGGSEVVLRLLKVR